MAAAVLFLNGSGASVNDVRPMLGPFQDRLTVAIHDQRGLGQSAIPAGLYTMVDCAANAAGVLDRLGWDAAGVVGISFGGMAAQELAVTWPARIERLALLCTSPGGNAPSYPLQELCDLGDDEYVARMVQLLDARFTPEWMAEHPGDELIVDLMRSRRAQRSSDAMRGERLQLEARRHHDVGDRLAKVTSPTLVAAGRYDGIAPLPNSELIADHVPDADLRIFDGGHLFVVQDITALPAIIDFLAS